MQHLYSSKISLDSLKDVLLKHLGENGRWERLNIYSTEAFNHARGPTLFFSSMAAHQSSYTTLFFLQHRVLVGGPLEWFIVPLYRDSTAATQSALISGL